MVGVNSKLKLRKKFSQREIKDRENSTGLKFYCRNERKEGSEGKKVSPITIII